MRIIILHGWSYDTAKWQPLLRDLRAKKLQPELPNIPVLTDKTDHGWTLNDYMVWLKQLIGKDKVVLVGHSNGGRLALNLASRYPECVERLVLIDSAGIPRTELISRVKRSIFWVLAKVGKPLSRFKTLRRLLYKLARAHDYLEADQSGRETMANLMQSDYTLDWSAITVPATIIWGAKDGVTPVRDAYIMTKRLQNVEPPLIIDDARHAPQFTHPEQVADYIAEAIRS